MTPAPRYAAPALLAAVLLASLLVHVRSLVHPLLLNDDFDLILKVWTWEDTRRTLWVPMNEHAWPVTRLWTRAVVWAAGPMGRMPLTAMLADRALLLAAVGLTYLFVRRERGHPAPGLAAAAVFGVSAVYQEAVYWFSASPAVGALATGTLGLLAAQRWRQSGSAAALGLSAVWSAVAPGWFAGGILAGPLGSLYLVGRPNVVGRGRWWAWAVPLLGPAAFLAVSLPLTGDRIYHADHYDGKTAAEAFAPLEGGWNALRSVADCLLLGAVGVPPWATLTRASGRSPVPLPVWVVLPVLAAAAAGLVWWWRRAADRRLILVGLACALGSYWLIHAARVNWSYERLTEWSRYGVYPQFGLALVAAGGWGGAAGSPFTRRQARTAGVLTAVLLVAQFPRGFFGSPPNIPDQAEVLRQIDRVDARCRELGVAGADAGAALRGGAADAVAAVLGGAATDPEAAGHAVEHVPGSQYNRWRYLRGSDPPRPLAPAGSAGLSQTLRP